MGDLGITGAAYSPTVNTTGLIGKVAKQVLEAEEIPYLFSRVSKGEVKYGKDVEASLMRAATGEAPTTDSPEFEKKAREALYFRTWTPRVYPIAVDYEDIDDASTDEASAQKIAAQYIDSLYQGATNEKNKHAIEAIKGAIDTIGGGTPAVVGVGALPEITDEASAKAYLSQVKKIAKKVRKGSASVNPAGGKVNASAVIMLAPQNTIVDVDVLARLDAMQEDKYGRYDVDYIIEYDEDEFPTLGGGTLIADERYFQFYEKGRNWGERLKIGADNGRTVEMALNTRDMYALCRLFNAAWIAQE